MLGLVAGAPAVAVLVHRVDDLDQERSGRIVRLLADSLEVAAIDWSIVAGLLEEALDEQRDVLDALAERRHDEPDHAEAEVEIGAKRARVHLRGEVPVCRRRDPDVDAADLGPVGRCVVDEDDAIALPPDLEVMARDGRIGSISHRWRARPAS
jgi:hypothetical protein